MSVDGDCLHRISNNIFCQYQVSFQGGPTIFDEGNFLYQRRLASNIESQSSIIRWFWVDVTTKALSNPWFKEFIRFKRVICPHPPLSWSKKRAHAAKEYIDWHHMTCLGAHLIRLVGFCSLSGLPVEVETWCHFIVLGYERISLQLFD